MKREALPAAKVFETSVTLTKAMQRRGIVQRWVVGNELEG
jgi:hypothetical protein